LVEAVRRALIAAPYAALVVDASDPHYGGEGSTVQVFDLRTGIKQPRLGGESAGCPDYSGFDGPCGVLDQIALGSDGVSAADSQTVYPVGGLSTPPDRVSCASGTSTCVAIDGSGHVFSSTDPSAGARAWREVTIAPPPYFPLVGVPGAGMRDG